MSRDMRLDRAQHRRMGFLLWLVIEIWKLYVMVLESMEKFRLMYLMYLDVVTLYQGIYMYAMVLTMGIYCVVWLNRCENSYSVS